VDLLTIASGVGHGAVSLAAAEAEPLFQINLFQVLIAAANFVVFLALMWTFAFKPISKMLADRKARVEEGLRDAEQARRDRESAETERLAALQEARREANDILARAQKVAQDSRDADIAATKADLERMRERASADLEAEKQRAIGELRAEVADLALRAAGRVIGETMTSEREKRLVKEFLAESGTGRSGAPGASGVSGGKGSAGKDDKTGSNG
jgi:F-type H+-transporting ATPase subunit b